MEEMELGGKRTEAWSGVARWLLLEPEQRAMLRGGVGVCGIPVPQESRTSRRGVHRKNIHLPRTALPRQSQKQCVAMFR